MFGNGPVAPGIKVFESQVFEFGLDKIHTEPIGDWRVNVQRLARNAPPRVRVHRTHRTHVVQAICELDEDHAQVTRHGQHQFTEAFRIGFNTRAELHLVQLGDTVHEFGNFIAELLGDLLLGQRRVFQRVMQDRRRHAGMVHAHAGQDAGHFDGVKNIRLAGLTGLAFVGLCAQVESAKYNGDLFRLEVGVEQVSQFEDRLR